MNKRLVTTVFACALCAACAFTACNADNSGTGSGGQSEGNADAVGQVTEEEWKAAFENTDKAKNFTCEQIFKSESEQNGNDDEKLLYYFTPETVCFDVSETGKSGEVWRSIDYYLFGGGANYCASSEDGVNWSASVKQVSYEEVKGTAFTYYGMSFAKEKNDTENFAVKDLYSFFTYADGKYTATLYGGQNETEVTVKIANGYVEYFSFESNEADGSGLTKIFVSYTFSKYATTEITVPEKATEAINQLKESN